MIAVSCACGLPVELTPEPVHQPPELSVIVPTFNEAANVHLVIDALHRSLSGIFWEVIFVDDDSPDGTADRVRGIADRDARVRCVRRLGRRGLAGASIEGMLSSSAPVVVIMDGDLQHDESLLPEMLRRIQSGDDLVIASRFCDVPGAAGSAGDGLSSTRLAGSRLATRLARTLLNIDVSDPMSGFFAMRRPAFEALAPRLSTQGFK
ncbi:MAG: glycosyltransferase, partial [Pseudorhizobium sp.]